MADFEVVWDMGRSMVRTPIVEVWFAEDDQRRENALIPEPILAMEFPEVSTELTGQFDWKAVDKHAGMLLNRASERSYSIAVVAFQSLDDAVTFSKEVAPRMTSLRERLHYFVLATKWQHCEWEEWVVCTPAMTDGKYVVTILPEIHDSDHSSRLGHG